MKALWLSQSIVNSYLINWRLSLSFSRLPMLLTRFSQIHVYVIAVVPIYRSSAITVARNNVLAFTGISLQSMSPVKLFTMRMLLQARSYHHPTQPQRSLTGERSPPKPTSLGYFWFQPS